MNSIDQHVLNNSSKSVLKISLDYIDDCFEYFCEKMKF